MDSLVGQKLTPAMHQFAASKKEYPDCLIMFRMGDFYEMFFEDAKTAARELEITLTSRGKGECKAPLAGIPFHALEPYLTKLVKKGYKVAICEQLEDPKKAKGIVKRGVTRIVTPGTMIDSTMLEPSSNNYIMALYPQLDKFGIALIDLSTGEFIVSEADSQQKVLNEMTKYSPAEILIPESLKVNQEFIATLKGFINPYNDHFFTKSIAYNNLLNHFKVNSLHGFGIDDDLLAINAAGALLNYLKDTQKTQLSYINKIRSYKQSECMVLDSSTLRNLELLTNIKENSARGSLISVLNKTKTPMGARFMKKVMLQPLLDKMRINERFDCVEELVNDSMLRVELVDALKEITDVERIISRVMYGNANARDLISLKNSLSFLPKIKSLISEKKSALLNRMKDMPTSDEAVALINSSIKDEPALTLREGNFIKEGYNAELDEIRNIAFNTKDWLVSLENQERTRTGIKSLKIGYNKVFGYFITVSNSNKNNIPSDYIRKQTLVNGERYITPELKEKENIILNAEERMNELEYQLFQEIITKISMYFEEVQRSASCIAELDVFLSFAETAVMNNYVRPKLNDRKLIELKACRHPVIETLTQQFVPNDFRIDNDNRLQIITGPNMSGKSTAMRQVALIQLMAQIGSFVPCSSADVCLVDRIFTRVGAYDDLTMGQSTFMVEMTETANILNNATDKSLIILDEIGRGTSTFDGISIAWAVAEYINNKIKAKTLFATHYHQLNMLAEKFSGIKNYNIAVSETDDDIIFLRKLVEGGTDKSYGIQVAKLAGVPSEVIERSKTIMNKLESEDDINERVNGNDSDNQLKKEVKKGLNKWF
jgi:DNA mismatch repair protein MutS